MERDLNISLIAGILLANLPVFSWNSRRELLTGIFVIALITLILITWIKDKKPKKKSLTAATARLK